MKYFYNKILGTIILALEIIWRIMMSLCSKSSFFDIVFLGVFLHLEALNTTMVIL